MWFRRACLLALACLLLWSYGAASTASPMQIPHPDDPSKTVEYFVEQPSGSGPWPTVILLHGHQDGRRPGGRDFADWGVLRGWAKRGYLAVAISQPGYGGSSGPADFSGPFTRRAVEGVIGKLREARRIMPGKLVLQGISRGALTAGLVAARDPSVAGLVLISGVYDLPGYVREPQPSTDKQADLRALMRETGGSADALGRRSVLTVARTIKSPTLIIQGAKDDRTAPDQARALAAALVRSGTEARAIIYPQYGHMVPVEVRGRAVDPFIRGVLGPGSKASG